MKGASCFFFCEGKGGQWCEGAGLAMDEASKRKSLGIARARAHARGNAVLSLAGLGRTSLRGE